MYSTEKLLSLLFLHQNYFTDDIKCSEGFCHLNSSLNSCNKKPLYLCSAVYRLRQLDWSTVNSFLYRSVKLSAGSCSVLACTFTSNFK